LPQADTPTARAKTIPVMNTIRIFFTPSFACL
jgi:hypothetical protein